MVKVPQICSTYQKYGQNTRLKANIPEIWSKCQKYGQHTKNMIKKQQKYGQSSTNMFNMVNVPEI